MCEKPKKKLEHTLHTMHDCNVWFATVEISPDSKRRRKKRAHSSRNRNNINNTCNSINEQNKWSEKCIRIILLHTYMHAHTPCNPHATLCFYIDFGFYFNFAVAESVLYAITTVPVMLVAEETTAAKEANVESKTQRKKDNDPLWEWKMEKMHRKENTLTYTFHHNRHTSIRMG